MAEDPDLKTAHREWLAIRPKSEAASSKLVLERAERRLIGSIKHHEARSRLFANAERVRHAQRGCLKATDLAVMLPTDDDDGEIERRRLNLAEATAAWEQMPVEQIIEIYARQVASKR